ncbi:ATP-binding cassette domain-containing protein [Georgenia sp. MJ170]|uniref:ATP-binding cassette domain-containing protein n=1 Tax=Georgenia sunbinii TaxID=3117728 RepID=UPI002F26C532
MPIVGDRISCSYDATVVLDGASIRVEPGQVVGLTGPSGSGKSTLARILTGLQLPDHGAVHVDDAPVSTSRGRMTGHVGLLHQSPRAATNPRMRLGEIIAEPLRRRRRAWQPPAARDGGGVVIDDGAAIADGAARALAARAGLTPDLLERYPGQVSDGQLQRACVARALAAHPRYLVCDEPTAMLDAAATAAVAGLLLELAAADIGILVVSHDHLLLEALCTTVVDLRDLSAAGAGADQRQGSGLGSPERWSRRLRLGR